MIHVKIIFVFIFYVRSVQKELKKLLKVLHFHSGTAEMIINMINIYLFIKNIWNFFLFPIMDFEKHITPLS